ncbi:MAG: aldehyde dehydrogenase family protein [Deltaproteobacteria bacterium]|nr:aldehyde dehydrogenase family protein [Deltaproteobacteria bacterium]
MEQAAVRSARQNEGAERLIRNIFEKQQANRWRVSGTTAVERIEKLKKLKEAILSRQGELQQAIHDDFKKNPGEVDVTEVFPVVAEIGHAIRHLSGWMKPHRVKTPFVLFGTRSEVRYEPKGVVLILSPWNYPFQLLLSPLVAAIVAGNCAILKPSAKVPQTSAFLKRLITDLFPEDEIALIEGGHDMADALLELPFDHIFFTGSPPIGRRVMGAAAKNLASVTLELGGKSPVIVDETADLKKTAERLVWGKFINAGQTCVAPDYLLIDKRLEADFIREAKSVIESRYGKDDASQEASGDFCRLVTREHLQHLKSLLDASVQAGARIETGGKINSEGRYLSPTLLSNVRQSTPIMREEIFGPILPILTFERLEEAIQAVQSRPKPLALYIFSKNSGNIEQILRTTSAGGTCVNSLIIHLANADLPFGGIGESGMGNYHGFYGFKTFSHERAVLRQGRIDILRFFYPPYTRSVRAIIRLATKFFAR